MTSNIVMTIEQMNILEKTIFDLQQENASLKSQLEAMAKALEACMTEDDYFYYPKADAALSAYRNTKE